MSVKRSNGLSVKTVVSGENYLQMPFFHRGGPVLRTHGTQKGTLGNHTCP